MGNNPWSYIGVLILVGAGGIILLSLLSSFVIALASGRHADKTVQTTLKAMEKKLPGKNCGSCGCQSCGDYAAAVLNRDAVTPCPYCTEETSKDLEAMTDRFWKEAESQPAELPKGWKKFGS